MHHRLALVEVLDKGLDTALELEDILARRGLLEQADPHAGVEEGQFAQAARQHVVVELGELEDRGIWPEPNLGAALVARAELGQRCLRLATSVLLLIAVAVAPDRQQKFAGERVDGRNADTVQTTRNLVAVLVELTARVQHGHDDLGRGDVELGMQVYRNASAVVGDRHAAIGVDDDTDLGAMPRQRLVDGVVDHLEYQMVQAGAIVGVADVHARTLAHGFESLQRLDAGRVVLLLFVGHLNSFHQGAVGTARPCSSNCSTWNTA